MGNFQSVSTKDKSILQLKVQRDKLKQYEKQLMVVIDKEVAIAREQLRLKNHHAARLALAKKKYQEQLLEKTGQQLLTLEQLVGSIEYALVEQQVLKGLEEGNKVLKIIHQETSLDKVEKIMDDTRDAIEYQNEIQDLISNHLTEHDEEEIMKELDALVEQETDAKILELPSTNHLPQVQLETPKVSEKTKKQLVPA